MTGVTVTLGGSDEEHRTGANDGDSVRSRGEEERLASSTPLVKSPLSNRAWEVPAERRFLR